MSYTNNWTQIIRQLMIESHTKQELMKLSNTELKKLHGEYMDKGDEDSVKEAKVIKEILDERGDDKEEMNESRRTRRTGRRSDETEAEFRARNAAAGEAWLKKKMETHIQVPADNIKGYVWVPKSGDDKKEVSEGKVIDKIKKVVQKVIKKGKNIAGTVGQTIIDDQRAKGIFDQSKY